MRASRTASLSLYDNGQVELLTEALQGAGKNVEFCLTVPRHGGKSRQMLENLHHKYIKWLVRPCDCDSSTLHASTRLCPTFCCSNIFLGGVHVCHVLSQASCAGLSTCKATRTRRVVPTVAVDGCSTCQEETSVLLHKQVLRCAEGD